MLGNFSPSASLPRGGLIVWFLFVFYIGGGEPLPGVAYPESS